MALKEILAAFASSETLPVDLGKVSQWIIDKKIQDEIEFIGVDIDTGVIRGYLYRFRYSAKMYGDHTNAAHIYYGKDQGPEWINLVCAKELIHLMDSGNAGGRKEQFDQLVSRLVLPRDLDILLEDPNHVRMDRMGDLVAAALLLPPSARELLITPYKRGELTEEDIAKFAMMPTRYVRVVMSDRWEKSYELLHTL